MLGQLDGWIATSSTHPRPSVSTSSGVLMPTDSPKSVSFRCASASVEDNNQFSGFRSLHGEWRSWWHGATRGRWWDGVKQAAGRRSRGSDGRITQLQPWPVSPVHDEVVVAVLHAQQHLLEEVGRVALAERRAAGASRWSYSRTGGHRWCTDATGCMTCAPLCCKRHGCCSCDPSLLAPPLTS